MVRNLLTAWILAAIAGTALGEDLTDLEVGTRIKAKGVFAPRETTMHVEKLQFRESDDDDFEFSGRITGLHSETLAFRLESIWIVPTGDDISRRDLRRIERLQLGDYVKVEGEWNAQKHLVADSVERQPAAKRETSIEGVIEEIRPGTESGAHAVLGGVDLLISVNTPIKGTKSKAKE